ncbi:MAG: hypothetical protein KKG04_07695 [Candidatus Thermoplasmatota archaeon]|nr:hypothetical protein [Candidatus Thermoplasmatota archaeon]
MTLTTIIIPINQNIVSATGYYYGELDYNWVHDVGLDNLSKIVHYNKTYNIPKGRFYGANGSLYAAQLIEDWMNESSQNLNVTIYKEAVGDNSYNGEEGKVIRRANNKTDIVSCGLLFRNTTSSATIPLTEFYPLPKLIYEDDNITSEWPIGGGDHWKEVVSIGRDAFRDIAIIPTSYVVMDNTINSIEHSVTGEIVQINDYSTAINNQTQGKLHLLEFETNECADIYQNKIDYVAESNGTGFIIITSNPSYMKNLNIDTFGVTISPEDGETATPNELMDKSFRKDGFEVIIRKPVPLDIITLFILF